MHQMRQKCTADAQARAAPPSGRKNAARRAGVPATRKQLFITMFPQFCRGRPLFLGPDGALRSKVSGSKTDRRTGSVPGRLASLPMKTISFLLFCSLRGRWSAMLSTVLP